MSGRQAASRTRPRRYRVRRQVRRASASRPQRYLLSTRKGQPLWSGERRVGARSGRSTTAWRMGRVDPFLPFKTGAVNGRKAQILLKKSIFEVNHISQGRGDATRKLSYPSGPESVPPVSDHANRLESLSIGVGDPRCAITQFSAELFFRLFQRYPQEAGAAGWLGERVISIQFLPFPLAPVRQEGARSRLSRARARSRSLCVWLSRRMGRGESLHFRARAINA